VTRAQASASPSARPYGSDERSALSWINGAALCAKFDHRYDWSFMRSGDGCFLMSHFTDFDIRQTTWNAWHSLRRHQYLS